MSLLLDALKRAEQEKHTRQVDRPAPMGTPAPQRPAPAAAGASPALELQPIAVPAGQGPSAGVSTTARGDAHAAQALFKAKAAAEAPRNRGALFAAAGAIAVVVLAAGAYVWYSLNTLTPRAAVARPRPSPIAPPAADVNAPKPESLGLTPQAPALKPSQAIQPSGGTTPAPAQPARAHDTSQLVAMLKEAAPQSPPPLRLERSVERPRIAPEVSQGYDALRSGDLAAARASYEKAFAADPTSVDALLGLATIDARAGHRAAAIARYRAALQLDPRNTTALAGIAALTEDARPEATETQLRVELARFPASAALHASLGNVYAAQARWAEAQDEYFEAHRIEPENADVAYNLAVSLDHLGQAKLAAGFYRRALEGAREHATQFDPAPVARRLDELQR